MRLCFIYDEKNEKYSKLARQINQYLELNKSEIKVINIQSEEEKSFEKTKINITKNDICVIFSDSATELKHSYEDLKRPKNIIVITENLTVEYIMLCVDLTKHICYAKNNISEICSRIEGVYEKLLE